MTIRSTPRSSAAWLMVWPVCRFGSRLVRTLPSKCSRAIFWSSVARFFRNHRVWFEGKPWAGQRDKNHVHDVESGVLLFCEIPCVMKCRYRVVVEIDGTQYILEEFRHYLVPSSLLKGLYTWVILFLRETPALHRSALPSDSAFRGLAPWACTPNTSQFSPNAI